MRKGDEKRLELLDAAEKLFCQHGYDKTSVQDILNATGASKGGFYHHFTSKEEVLTELCERRAERASAYTAGALNQASTPMERINAVLHGYIPVRREESAFLNMLLPTIAKPEGRGMALIYQEALHTRFLPLLKAEIAAAAAAEVVFPPVKDIECVILDMVNHAWMTIAAEINEARSTEQRLEIAVCLTLLEKYRRAVELLLDAPYGTVEIIRVEELAEMVSNIG